MLRHCEQQEDASRTFPINEATPANSQFLRTVWEKTENA